CGASPDRAVRRIAPDTDRHWDLLPLALARREDVRREGISCGATAWRDAEWGQVSQVSILFRNVEERRGFGGEWCRCKPRDWAEEQQQCITQGHVGMLGKVRVLYRRKLEKWSDALNQGQVEVVRGGPGGTERGGVLSWEWRRISVVLALSEEDFMIEREQILCSPMPALLQV